MGTATINLTVCRMSSLLLILSTYFDDNGGAGPTKIRFFRAPICVLLKGCWIWCLVENSVDDYPREDTQTDSPFL